MDVDKSRYFWKNDKVTLRLAREDDWEAHYGEYFDSHARFILEYELELPHDPVEDKAWWTRLVSPEAKHGRTMFAAEDKDGALVGIANLNSIDERNGTFSVGIMIFSAHRGHGHGYEMMRMIGRYAFFERRLHKWNSAYVEGNEGSAALHKKLGFVVEGRRREVIYHEGRYWDEIVCGLTAEEFMAVPQNLERG